MTEQRVSVWKDDTTEQHTWCVEVDGESFCEIVRICETYALGGIRARGTKVEQYSVDFDDGRKSVSFHACCFKNARSAFEAAMHFARSEAAKKGGRA